MFDNIISKTDSRGWTYAKCEAEGVHYVFMFEQYEQIDTRAGRVELSHKATVYARVFTPQKVGRCMNHLHLVRAEMLLPYMAPLTV